jgi:hypothetical protein
MAMLFSGAAHARTRPRRPQLESPGTAVLLSGGIVSRPYRDYGYDFMLTRFNARGEVEAGIIFFQLKATDDLPLFADG